jgi:hypothetical protein
LTQVISQLDDESWSSFSESRPEINKKRVTCWQNIKFKDSMQIESFDKRDVSMKLKLEKPTPEKAMGDLTDFVKGLGIEVKESPKENPEKIRIKILNALLSKGELALEDLEGRNICPKKNLLKVIEELKERGDISEDKPDIYRVNPDRKAKLLGEASE